MIKSLLKLARPSQWVKNGVVLAPLVFAGSAGQIHAVEYAVLATAIFCLCSSGIYIINDIVDQESDRNHPTKRLRPIAAQEISTVQASGFATLFLMLGFAGGLYIGTPFLWYLLAFVALNVAYSFVLKRLVIVDAMSIALSFVLRAVAGAAAIAVPASKWMLINTFLLALFLAFGKRRHELVLLQQSAERHRVSLLRYSPYLLDQLIGVTTPSVVVMYMLYSFSSEVSTKLGTENLYLTIPFVVYGIFRYLYLIHREEKGGSPTHVLFTDRPILFTVVLWLATVVLVLYFR